MNRTDTASVRPRGLKWRLADVSLRFKLYVALGVSILGLLVIAGVTVSTSVVNQRLVDRTLTRQRQLADLASAINNDLLTVQNQAFEFYDTWDSTGFEASGQGGFEAARRAYVTPLREQIDRIRDNIAAIEQLEPDESTRAVLASIASNVDAYETSLLEMSDHMENLGFYYSGEAGQTRAAMGELQALLDDAGLESLKATTLEIRRQEKNFFLYSDLASARIVQEWIGQFGEQIAAIDDDQLSSEDRARLDYLIERYLDHFLAAANHFSLLDQSRGNLISQSDLTGVLVTDLFEQQQIEFDATLEQLRGRQSNITFVVIGLALIAFFVSVSVAYIVADQIVRPVQMLGEAAERLGAGDLDVRAAVRGQDEIGATAAAFNFMADRLRDLLTGLERRVADRTRALEQRSSYLEASAEVGRAATSILETDQLIRQVVDLIRDRFGLYYVGLFLVDEAGEWAALRAGTGEFGQMMLAREHRLAVGGDSMIGQCVSRDEARIALDVGEEAARFDNPLLPDTRSELALPLRSRGRVVGAMSVQSVEESAFDEAAIAVLQTMADQVAVALDNARLFAEAQAAVDAARSAYGEMSREAWSKLLRAQPDMAYRSDERGVARAEGVWRPEMERALREGETMLGDGDGERRPLAIPIKVRGDVIGVLDTYKPGGADEWMPEEVALLETLADQLGTALESARLYGDAQRSAARERLVSEITDRMRRAADVEGIVQAAVDELFSVLGTSRAFVRLTSPDQREARRPLRDQREARRPLRDQREARRPLRDQRGARRPLRDQREARRRSPSPTRDVKVE
ncbi:MAG TPA: GAF domain-containing protein [Thermoflexia bacterium]|nr:GAF domain-containing protein [Thermoflexia bacterium]